MTIDETTMERLAFNQYLFETAVEQSREPQPMAATAVLTFHDAVELFLQHSSEYLNANKAGKSHVTFMGYWEIITSNLPDGEELGQKPAMRRLNDSRKNLKHSGTRPNTSDIDSFRSSTIRFFEENTPKVFGIEFSDISLVNLVEYDEVRELLEEAESFIADENFEEGIKKIAIAYDTLFFDYDNRVNDEFGYKPFDIVGRQPFMPSSRDMRKSFGRDMEKFCENMMDSISAIEEAIRVISLGMDYRRYSRFESITPHLMRSLNGEVEATDLPDDAEITYDDLHFCLDFVIESAIELQKIDSLTSS